MASPSKTSTQKTSKKTSNRPGSSSGGQAGARDHLSQASADLLRKLPPQNLEAEQAVLGGVFQHPKALHSIVDVIQAEDFYSPAHQMIFNAFIELYNSSKPVDPVTVHDFLASREELEAVGGPVYLAELGGSVVTSANALHHAGIVRDKSTLRRLIDASGKIITDCYQATNVEELLDGAEKEIFEISDAKSRSTFRTSADAVKAVFQDLEQRVANRSVVTGVPTTYEKFDEITAGMQPSDLIIVAGRPSMGKTAFALNMSLRSAIHHETRTAVFSLEMSTEQLIQRMLCSFGKVNLANLRRGFLDDEDWTRLYDAAQYLSGAPVFIDDTPALSTLELRARCRRLKSEQDIQLVIVDYLQLMRASQSIDSREQEISDISRTLKAIAKELNVPVIALSQLNRKVEERTNKRPMLSDLRESGAIEQDADVIIFIYRDEVYNKKEDNPKRGIAEIIVGKQRNGPVGEFELAFLNTYTSFENLAETPSPSENDA
jgi:replicative DNA helicase